MGDIYHTQPDLTPKQEIVDPGMRKTWRDRPWWLYALVLIFLYTAWSVYSKENLTEAFLFIITGLRLTITTALTAYGIAILIGLLAGMGRISRNPILNNLATFYVEFIRGVPMLVLIFFIALVGVPTVIDGLNAIGFTALGNKAIPNEVRAVIALSVTYGAFLAEIFRAGIQSITRGQMEAARSLGMSYGQAMRYVILPQAIRNVLPALGNDFVAMVKDSSLVSLLAVGDITYRAKLYSGSTFRFRESYTILSLLYLLMTVILSRLVHQIERRMSND
jgi:polar amino acid transport system permease protein